MIRKTIAVARKEFRQIGRDRRTLMTLLFVPAFFLLLYGYALNFDIRHVGLGVDDRDRSAESRALIAAFVNSGYFDLVASIDTTVSQPKTAPTAIGAPSPPATIDRDGSQRGSRRPRHPERLGRALPHGQRGHGAGALSGDNANTATTVMGYATTIVRSSRYATTGAAGAVRRPRRSSGSGTASGITRRCAAASSWCPA